MMIRSIATVTRASAQSSAVRALSASSSSSAESIQALYREYDAWEQSARSNRSHQATKPAASSNGSVRRYHSSSSYSQSEESSSLSFEEYLAIAQPIRANPTPIRPARSQIVRRHFHSSSTAPVQSPSATAAAAEAAQNRLPPTKSESMGVSFQEHLEQTGLSFEEYLAKVQHKHEGGAC